MSTLPGRLMAKVKRADDPNGCWEWIGALGTFGYGHIVLNGSIIHAHRASWIVYNGPIPDGKLVLHRCDSPPCTNPRHLFLGSTLDNIADKMSKGRSGAARGTQSPFAKVSPLIISAIRSEYATGDCTHRSLGAKYGLSYSHVGKIIRRRKWAHT